MSRVTLVAYLQEYLRWIGSPWPKESLHFSHVAGLSCCPICGVSNINEAAVHGSPFDSRILAVPR